MTVDKRPKRNRTRAEAPALAMWEEPEGSGEGRSKTSPKSIFDRRSRKMTKTFRDAAGSRSPDTADPDWSHGNQAVELRFFSPHISTFQSNPQLLDKYSSDKQALFFSHFKSLWTHHAAILITSMVANYVMFCMILDHFMITRTLTFIRMVYWSVYWSVWSLVPS